MLYYSIFVKRNSIYLSLISNIIFCIQKTGQQYLTYDTLIGACLMMPCFVADYMPPLEAAQEDDDIL